MLVLALRHRRRQTLVGCVLLSLLALGISAYVEQISPKTNFYWLPFRIWEFFAGIGAAMLFARGAGNRVPRTAAAAIGLLAVAAFCAAALLFSGTSASVLTQGLLAVAATAWLCLGQERLGQPLRGLFTNPLAQHLGRISYSWYLWHWPPLVIAYLLLGHAATGWQAAALTLVGYALALVSWRLFERDAARSAWLARPSRTIGLLLAFLLFAAVAGMALIESDGFLNRYPERAQVLLRAQMDRPDGRCAFLTRLEQGAVRSVP